MTTRLQQAAEWLSDAILRDHDPDEYAHPDAPPGTERDVFISYAAECIAKAAAVLNDEPVAHYDEPILPEVAAENVGATAVATLTCLRYRLETARDGLLPDDINEEIDLMLGQLALEANATIDWPEITP